LEKYPEECIGQASHSARHHQVLNVRDMEASHRFWRDTIGLPVIDGIVGR
jgi:catechol 2,3-dioxygenase-like lactoylglutathione lyase family enzyme